MDDIEKISVLAMMVDADEDEERDRLIAYLTIAKSKILNRMYPFGIPDNVTGVPSRYEQLQIEAAAFMYRKQGAEGQSQHSENGVTRTYAGADLPEAMMQAITPRGVAY